ncbi:MAG: ArsR/SmtB family transcription factor [Promethearchaeota archaeon]
MVRLFSTLGDATRLKILVALAERELCAHDISVILKIGPSTVTHHLNKLRAANLVKSRREGKHVVTSLHDEHVHELIKIAKEHASE